MRRSLAIGALATVLVGAGAGPAAADTEKGGNGFVPVETVIPDYYATQEFAACGTTITFAAGEVRKVQIRQTTRPDGTSVTDFRGDATVDLTRADTGAMIDELDISGRGRQVVSPDGSEVTIVLFGPSILIMNASDPVDVAAFREAGLPGLAYFEHGKVVFHITVDPDTGKPLAEDIDVHARIIDLCAAFDRENEGHGHGDDDDGHGHGDDGHGHEDGHDHGHGGDRS
jgi:hypothetical protein